MTLDPRRHGDPVRLSPTAEYVVLRLVGLEHHDVVLFQHPIPISIVVICHRGGPQLAVRGHLDATLEERDRRLVRRELDGRLHTRRDAHQVQQPPAVGVGARVDRVVAGDDALETAAGGEDAQTRGGTRKLA